jgi:hypothetical protein
VFLSVQCHRDGKLFSLWVTSGYSAVTTDLRASQGKLNISKYLSYKLFVMTHHKLQTRLKRHKNNTTTD